MRLPAPTALLSADHLFLYEHDATELHNGDRSDFRYLTYRTRLDAVLDAVLALSPAHVLDVGCAQGNLSLLLAERGVRVTAVDLRPSFLTYARLKYESGDLRLVAASAARLPFRAAIFDLAVLGELLEHVSYPERLVADAARLLKPGGFLVITTPNGSRLHTGLPTLIESADRSVLQSREHRPDADGHLFLLTKKELLTMARAAGLRVVVHRFIGSPWITGRLMGRVVARWLPVSVRRLLDRLTSNLPWWRVKLCDSQLMVAVRSA